MAKAKQEPRSWLVPMEFVVSGYVIVTAYTAKEATTIAMDLSYERREDQETTDWKVTGKPVVNE